MLRRISAWAPASEPLSDVITLDFINTALEPGARAGIELTLCCAPLSTGRLPAEFEEAEVRGKGAVPRSFGQRDTRDERVARLRPRRWRLVKAAGQAPYGKPDLLMIKIREWFQL